MSFGLKHALRTAKPIFAFFILSLFFATVKLQHKHPVISTCCRLQDAEKKLTYRRHGASLGLISHHLTPSSHVHRLFFVPTLPLFQEIICFQVMLVTFLGHVIM